MSAPRNFDYKVPTSNALPSLSPSPQPNNIQQAVPSTIQLHMPVVTSTNQYLVIVQNLIVVDFIVNTFLIIPYLALMVTSIFFWIGFLPESAFLGFIATCLATSNFSLLICALRFGSYVWEATKPGSPTVFTMKKWIHVTTGLVSIDILVWLSLTILFCYIFRPEHDYGPRLLVMLAAKGSFLFGILVAMRMVSLYFVNAFRREQESILMRGGILGTANAGQMLSTPSTLQIKSNPLPKGDQDSDSDSE